MASRIPVLCVVLLLVSQASSARNCLSRRAVDVAERAMHADVVVSGTAKKLLRSPDDTSYYAAEILVYWIYKGESTFPPGFELPARVFVTGFGPEEQCHNEVELGDTHVFFLKIGGDHRLALNYYWKDDNRTFADGVGVMQLVNLDETVETVVEIRKSCQNSVYGCCPDGVTQKTGDGDRDGCMDLQVNITDPDPDDWTIVQVIEEPLDLFDKMGILNLPSGVTFADKNTCPDVSLLSFKIGPEAQLVEDMFTVFEDMEEVPKEFSIIVLSKQSAGDHSYLLALHQQGRRPVAVKLQEETVEFEFIDINGMSRNVSFDADLTDDKYHRFAFEVRADSVSLYVDCALVKMHPIQREVNIPMDGEVIIGNGRPLNSEYEGIIEKLMISSVEDATTLCRHLPDCPEPPPPPPTDPPPTTASPLFPTTTDSTSQPHKPSVSVTPSQFGSGDFDTEEPSMTEAPPSDAPCGGQQHGCPFYGFCVEDMCVCPHCKASGLDPVCGSDMVTYGDKCALKRTSCMEKREITYRRGPCDDEDPDEPTTDGFRSTISPYPTTEPTSSGMGDDSSTSSGTGNVCMETCGFGGRCEPDGDGGADCVCDFACVSEYLPVCGSDSKTYDNECLLRTASCQEQQNITILKDVQCSEVCTGGFEPLRDDNGQFYQCNNNDDCPAASTCDLMNPSLCCPVVITPTPTPMATPTLPVNCDMRPFGCCKDGVTAATGEDFKGCPGEVDFVLEISRVGGVTQVTPFCPDKRTNATAYSIASDFNLNVATTEIYPIQFPKYFSILVTIRVSESVNGSILTVYGDVSDMQIGLSINSIGLEFMYAGNREGQRHTVIVPAVLNDGAYHRLALSFYKGDVVFYVDCDEVKTVTLDRNTDALFDSMGLIKVGGRLRCGNCGIEGDVDQLSIIPDPNAAEGQCHSLQSCPLPTLPPPTTSPPTTFPPATSQLPDVSTTMPAATSRKPPLFKVPNFYSDKSYLRFSPPPESQVFSLEISFTATGGDGVIFYGDDSDSGDFVALSYEGRILILRLNDGGNTTTVHSIGKKLKKGELFKAIVTVNKKSITLAIESRKRSSVKRGDGNKILLSDVFVGGIRRDKVPIAAANVLRGFEGCVHSLKIGDDVIDLQSPLDSEDVAECGDTPSTTEKPGVDTTPSTTEKPGADTPTPTTAITDAPIRLPAFSGADSYLAYDAPADSRSFQLDMQFVVTGNDGLMFYVGNAVTGDFISVAYVGRRVQVRMSNGSESLDIDSAGKKLKKGSVFNISLSVKKGSVVLDVTDRSKAKAKRNPDKFKFGGSQMFIGGIPAEVVAVENSLRTSGQDAFEGCVLSVSVNEEVLDLSSPVMRKGVSDCAS